MDSLSINNKATLLITGATGFLGTHVARHLIQKTDVEIIALVRSDNFNGAQQRLSREWGEWPDLITTLGNRIHPVAGDVTLPNLGLEHEIYITLARQVSYIIHLAADIRMFEPIETLRKANMAGMKRVLAFAKAANEDHGLQRFAHISTAYVAGERTGLITEDELTDLYGFSNNYERSKFEVEKFVREANENLPITIIRPGIIVGDSISGVVKTFNTVYYPLRMYLKKHLQIIPAKPSFRLDITPVDYVAQGICSLCFNPAAAGLTFHLTPPHECMPCLSEIFLDIRHWAKEEMGEDLKRPLFLPLPQLEKINKYPTVKLLLKKLVGKEFGTILELLPYFRKQPVFLRENTDRLLGPYTHRWQDSLPQQLEYAVRNNFGRQLKKPV